MRALRPCPECGAAMKAKSGKAYRYKASGLSNVFLTGVEVRTCGACGEEEVVIPRIEALHRAIARAVIAKRDRLAPEEVRFLRKVLGLSGQDFAARIGVDPATVSRWENAKDPIGPIADRALRLMVAVTPPKSDYSIDELAEIGEGSTPVHASFAPSPKGWIIAA